MQIPTRTSRWRVSSPSAHVRQRPTVPVDVSREGTSSTSYRRGLIPHDHDPPGSALTSAMPVGAAPVGGDAPARPTGDSQQTDVPAPSRRITGATHAVQLACIMPIGERGTSVGILAEVDMGDRTVFLSRLGETRSCDVAPV